MNKPQRNEPREGITASLDFTGIGRQITRARTRKNLTKQDAAFGTGFSAQLLTKVEGNEHFPSLINLSHISKALDVPVDVLLQDCHKDFLVFAIGGYLSRMDAKEICGAVAALEELMKGAAYD